MSHDKDEHMQLYPADFKLLDKLEHKRNVSSNLAEEIDRERSYVNTRLPTLADYGLVDKIGPAERSGLYEINEKGLIVLEIFREKGRDGVDFDAELEQRLEERGGE